MNMEEISFEYSAPHPCSGVAGAFFGHKYVSVVTREETPFTGILEVDLRGRSDARSFFYAVKEHVCVYCKRCGHKLDTEEVE